MQTDLYFLVFQPVKMPLINIDYLKKITYLSRNKLRE